MCPWGGTGRRYSPSWATDSLCNYSSVDISFFIYGMGAATLPHTDRELTDRILSGENRL